MAIGHATDRINLSVSLAHNRLSVFCRPPRGECASVRYTFRTKHSRILFTIAPMMPGLGWSGSALIFSLIFASPLAGCSLAVDANRVQCTTKADCTSRGSAFANSTCVDSVCEDPTWGCLSRPPVTSNQSPPYKVTVLLRDLVSQMPVPNAQVKLCRKIDVDCANPVATATSDSSGGATFTVDMMAFSGYLFVQAEGFLDTLYFFNPAIDRDQTVSPLSLATPTANFGLLFQLGRQMSQGYGNVVVTAKDCTGAPAGGVSFQTPSGDGMTSQFYLIGGLPTDKANQTESMSGYGGFINVPAGAATVTASLENPRADLGTISLLVRDGAITYTQVVPIGK